jgi:hypothetical protein
LTLHELFDVFGAIRNVDEYFAVTIVSRTKALSKRKVLAAVREP